ncbi:type II toxin-antitoxin system death-on-curing family toxin [Salipiger mucosus]|uniref:Death on curing protein, Doc toxin n=1 Tax=Salipiger mucosus DSM 16094 TaxID=1123237 RepID=S9QVI4_9RHOB|nr:type II toxin-antitoxin system death-on-curing family toxin [Salipiger mucosus]EPX83562.1 Death on curing protein, Doc toxin [Salipiger mucosus DSM 16094]
MISRTADDNPLAVEDELGIPNCDTLVIFHDIEVGRSGGLPGLRDEGLLESAVGSVVNAMSFDPSMDQVDAAAKLAFGIMKNHPFADGNKRTALGAAEMTLRGAGYRIKEDFKTIADAIVDFAANAKDHTAMSDWLRERLEVTMDNALGEAPAGIRTAFSELSVR